MAPRDTFDQSIKTSNKTRTAAVYAANAAYQPTIDAAGVNVAYNNAVGNFVTLNANANLFAAKKAAGDAEQAAVALAKATLRASGDLGPI
jgi:uncharacterized membrane protein